MTYLITIAILVGLLSVWIVVQQLARGYAARHPEFGPVREDGETGCGGCGNHCSGHCESSSAGH